MTHTRPVCLAGILILLSAPSLRADPLKTIAKHLAKGLAKSDNKKVAVLSFPYHDGDVSSGSSIIAERITNFLAERSDVEVVERSLLSKALEEVKLEETGAVDPASAQKLGKVLGVEAVVTGTLIDLDEMTTEVNARLIKTDTGVVLAADTERIERSWDDDPHPATPAVVVGSISGSTASPEQPAGPAHLTYDTSFGYVDVSELPPARAPAQGSGSVRWASSSPSGSYGGPAVAIIPGVTPPSPSVATLSRIYTQNPDSHARAVALLSIGGVLERQGRTWKAQRVYRRLIREFPDQHGLREEAVQRLHAMGPGR